jgi:hypothetical protein
MTTLTTYPRRFSGGLSLDEAARAVRSGLEQESARCPGCGTVLRLVVGEEHRDPVWMFRCDECGRGVVFMRLHVPDPPGWEHN